MPVEQVLNHLIALDPHVGRALQTFSGKVLQVSSTSPRNDLTIRFDGTRVRLSALAANTLNLEPDAKVSGSASELIALLLAGAESKPLANQNITVAGDALFVQELFKLTRELDIDWQDYLPPALVELGGDVVTRELDRLGKEASRWGQDARTAMRRNFSDYVTEEISLVPAARELDSFSEQLDQLKLAIDRAAARLAQLQSRMDNALKNQQLST